VLLDVKVSQHIWMTFGTPRLERRFDNPALNDSLHRIVLGREALSPVMGRAEGINNSNVRGWRSEQDLLSWPEPEITTLKGMIHEAAGQVMQLAGGGRQVQIRAEFELVASASIDRRGSYSAMHSYPGSHWSGVYCVSRGKPDVNRPLNGTIEFEDPRPAAPAALIPGFEFGYRERIDPEPGLMLIFPSWHLHMVHPFHGDGEQISIAFNLTLHDFRLLTPTAPPG
jgi:uncharacterized protein (TIGR02466 family)